MDQRCDCRVGPPFLPWKKRKALRLLSGQKLVILGYPGALGKVRKDCLPKLHYKQWTCLQGRTAPFESCRREMLTGDRKAAKSSWPILLFCQCSTRRRAKAECQPQSRPTQACSLRAPGQGLKASQRHSMRDCRNPTSHTASCAAGRRSRVSPVADRRADQQRSDNAGRDLFRSIFE